MDPVQLRFAAALLHSVPDGRLLVEHADGTIATISFDADAEMSPCDFRALIAAACVDGNVTVGSYPDRVATLRFERGFDPVGGILRRTEKGKLGFWFASTLEPLRTRDLLAAHTTPAHPDTLEAGVLGDTELRVSVVCIKEVAPCARRHLQCIANELHGQAAVAELIDDGVWATSHRR